MICSLKNLNLSNIFNLKFQFITLLISVSASDRYRPILKKPISVIYQIGQYREWDLSVNIGIGWYEKKLISHTLDLINRYIGIYYHEQCRTIFFKVKLKKLPPILTKIIPLFIKPIKPQCICKLIFSRLLQMAGSQNCDFLLKRI